MEVTSAFKTAYKGIRMGPHCALSKSSLLGWAVSHPAPPAATLFLGPKTVSGRLPQ